MNDRRRFFCTIALVLGLVTSAGADDLDVGKLLRLKSGPAGAALTFTTWLPSAAFPPIGSTDDPATGTPGGLTVEIFTRTQVPVRFTAGPGVGNPGWMAVDGAVDQFIYRGAGDPFRKIVLRDGKLLRIRLADAGLALTPALEAVAIRVTTGNRRTCAFFGPASVVKTSPGSFIARNAPPPPPFLGFGCEDERLLNALGFDCTKSGAAPVCGGDCPPGGVCASLPLSGICKCALASNPCGDTAPACNGTCAPGEECAGLQGPFGVDSCTCTPIGVTPCGGVDDPSCGGTCPDDGVCADSGRERCVCASPHSSCGDTAPVCNGECSAGEECVQIDTGSLGGVGCSCAPIGVTPCGAVSDQSCSADCPAGSSCQLADGGTGVACRCIADGAICGGGFGACIPPDAECIYRQVAMDYICLLETCGGSYPSCGGVCGSGRTCVPLDAAGVHQCVCATPSLSCEDAACGGLACPSGEVCTVAFQSGGPSCSCEPQ